MPQNLFEPVPSDGNPIMLAVRCANWRSLMPVSEHILLDVLAHPLLKREALERMRSSFGETTPQGSEDHWQFANVTWSKNNQRLEHMVSAELIPRSVSIFYFS